MGERGNGEGVLNGYERRWEKRRKRVTPFCKNIGARAAPSNFCMGTHVVTNYSLLSNYSSNGFITQVIYF